MPGIGVLTPFGLIVALILFQRSIGLLVRTSTSCCQGLNAIL